MGTRDQSLFASITAVINYLQWLGGKTEPQVVEEIKSYSGRRRLLKAALTWIEEYERTLSIAMLSGSSDVEGLPSIRGVELYGISDPSKVEQRVPTFSFNLQNADAVDVAKFLWEKHAIALLAENGGGFYSRTLKTFGKSIAVRASPVHFNTVNEVITFLRAVKDATVHFKA